ncbi:MAG: glutaminyl-peptide cyclotransferase [Pseudonocardiaceae bacterium]
MALLLTAVLAMLVGCTRSIAEPPRALATTEQLRVQVLATLPHDTTLYTQGLEIRDGVVYEGSGLVGQSRLRASALSGGATQRETTLPAPLFGEGLTVAGDRLWQLTWTNGVAIERDPATLTQRRHVEYQGEGWGLCYDGRQLVMSNGSDRLTFRDPVTFAPSGHVDVRLDGAPVSKLNELECAGGVVWANVYQTDRILRINPSTGAVTGVVDASGLFTPPSSVEVLNGIAAIPGTDEFLLTGKRWPSLFRVRFVPVRQ